MGLFFEVSLYVYFWVPVQASRSGAFIILRGFPLSFIVGELHILNGGTNSIVRYVVIGIIPALINAAIIYRIGKQIKS